MQAERISADEVEQIVKEVINRERLNVMGYTDDIKIGMFSAHLFKHEKLYNIETREIMGCMAKVLEIKTTTTIGLNLRNPV